jgi:hypothetical protein
MLISFYLVQSRSDTTRNIGTYSLGMTCFNLPGMTAKTSSPHVGRFVITYPSRKAELAKFGILSRGWTFFWS